MCADVPDDVSESIERVRETLETELADQLGVPLNVKEVSVSHNDDGTKLDAHVHFTELEDALAGHYSSSDVYVSEFMISFPVGGEP